MKEIIFDPRDLTLEELQDFFLQKGFSNYRATQLFSFLHKHQKIDLNELTNFSKDFRNQCKEWFCFNDFSIIKTTVSRDGTVKFLFRLYDNNFVESVLLSNQDRYTACISSQVGCRFGCIYCRTASMGLIRNLAPSEIIQQFSNVNKYLLDAMDKQINNIVFMGMGEPLDNYESVMKAVSIISQSGGYEVSKRRMTISTCGHIDGIKKMIKDKRSPQLAISFNTPDQSKREILMPCAKKWHISDLINASIEFSKAKGERVTLEYIMIRDFNDSISDADMLLKTIKKKSAFKINLIPFNPYGSSCYKPTSSEQILKFQSYLKSNRLSAHLRQTKGDDILAACGQLAVEAV